MTIPDSEKNDFKAICARLMNQNPEELAEGSLSPKDFRKIQIKHFDIWCEKAFVRKVPVRYIGLQVQSTLSMHVSLLLFSLSSTICWENFLSGNLIK